MGSAIASNFIWDLQHGRQAEGARQNPLERGETLALFYTFGSQIPFWSLRYKNFGQPVQIPSPELSQHHSQATGEWVNFYDRNDLLGYPIADINGLYQKAVNDQEVKVGNFFTGWNSFSHNAYWSSSRVTEPIAKSLAQVWRQVN
jgi:hypothetical protein